MKHSPMKIDHVLNDIVMLVLDGHEILKELGIDKNKIYVKKTRQKCKIVMHSSFIVLSYSFLAKN